MCEGCLLPASFASLACLRTQIAAATATSARDSTRLRHQEVTNGEKRKMIAGKITDGSYTRKLSPKVNVDERREKKKTEKRIDKTIKQEENKEGKDVGECARQYINKIVIDKKNITSDVNM